MNQQLLTTVSVCASALGIILAIQAAEDANNALALKPKKIWIKEWILKFGTNGHYENVYREWRQSDPDMFRRILRMYPEDFENLLRAVTPYIVKENTVFRDSITAEKRLAITLRFLVTGETFVSLSGQFCVGETSVRRIVVECCDAIVEVLKDYTKPPSSEDEWKVIANVGWERWNYPCSIGALDGKHVLIQPPQHSGSHYFNFHGQHSIVLMALVGPDLKFLHADVGVNGRMSDGGVWARSAFKKRMDDGLLNIPTDGEFPYHIVGDDAFPLSTKMMKPYPGKLLGYDDKKRIFNYRLSRLRRVSENAFGILVHRFQIYRAPIRCKPYKAIKFVMATLSLHNWLLSSTGTGPQYKDNCPEKPDFILPLVTQGGNRTPANAQEMRNLLSDFFIGEGSVAWQNNLI